ncbi:glycosyltransferase family 4 protein [Polaromonas sp. P2-4]|nr:glycosyltransferase family 4 protein [Polaromonas sp. P2-4]
MNSGTSPDKPICSSRRNDVIRDEIQQELVDSQSRINSLRIELQRAENDVYKVERLWSVLSREKRSNRKFAIVAYLAISCIVPDVIKWLLRPLTRNLKRIFRHLAGPGQVAAYQVRLASAAHPQFRVLHAIANFMTGGSSRLVVDIVEGLGHIYHQEVLTSFIPAPNAYQGVAVRECRSPYEMVAFLKKFQPDVLHVHYWGDVDFGWYDKVFRAAEEIGCKVVENVNTPVVPYRCQIVQHYVYVSDYVMRSFGRSGESSVVIHPGSEVEFFSRKGTGDTPENCIGMVYRLESDKLSQQSIDVFIEVAKRRPDTKILIVGDGSFLLPYKQAVLAHEVANSFSFTGAVPYSELPNIYAQMSVFVAPVWKESFGQVSSFAMSMGIPVVGYRVGGLEEIVDDDELLVPAGDSDRLANIIIKLLDDRKMRHLIGERNRLRAVVVSS